METFIRSGDQCHLSAHRGDIGRKVVAERTAIHNAHCDGVFLQCKVGRKRTVAGDDEIVGGSSTHHSTLFVRPVDKLITIISAGGQRNLGTIIVRACTVYCTASGRVGSGGDGKLVDSGLHSHIHIEGGHSEGVVDRINRDIHAATLCILQAPTCQMIVSIHSRSQGDGSTLSSLAGIDGK